MMQFSFLYLPVCTDRMYSVYTHLVDRFSTSSYILESEWNIVVRKLPACCTNNEFTTFT